MSRDTEQVAVVVDVDPLVVRVVRDHIRVPKPFPIELDDTPVEVEPFDVRFAVCLTVEVVGDRDPCCLVTGALHLNIPYPPDPHPPTA